MHREESDNEKERVNDPWKFQFNGLQKELALQNYSWILGNGKSNVYSSVRGRLQDLAQGWATLVVPFRDL